MEINETTEKITLEKEDSNKPKLVKILSVIAIIAIITILVVIKLQNPDFKLVYLILIILGVIGVGLLFFFSSWIYNRLHVEKEEKVEKIPKIATEEQLKIKVKSIIESELYQNHIKNYKNTDCKVINGNAIYDFEIEPLYSDKTSSDIIHVIMNANYIERLPTILFNPSVSDVKRAMNYASNNPNLDADVEKKEFFNPFTGFVEKSLKKTNKPIENLKKENKKEDIA